MEALGKGTPTDDIIADSLKVYLGDPPASPVAPPNVNHYKTGDHPGNVLRFNRKLLISTVYEDDGSAFKQTSQSEKKIKGNPDDTAIGAMSFDKLKKECEKRGFTAPPYHILVDMPDGGGVDTDGDGIGEGFLIISPEGDNDKTTTGPLQELAKFDPEGLLSKGLPKLKAASEAQLKVLLKLIVRDARFKNGQPIVTPAYFQRTCGDKLCTVLFWAWWVGMIVVACVAVASGDPLRLVRPTDYQGNPCGGTTYTTSGKLRMVYPRIAEDVATVANSQSATCASSEAGCFYGICVAECPAAGDIICNYEADAELAALPTADRAAARRSRATFRQGCWYNGMALTELLYRCFPFEVGTETNDYTCVETVSHDVWMSNAQHINITLSGDISTICPNAPNCATFRASFQADVAARLVIAATRVSITAISAGSVVVAFDVLPDGNGAAIALNTLNTLSTGGTIAGASVMMLQINNGATTNSTSNSTSNSAGRRLSLDAPAQLRQLQTTHELRTPIDTAGMNHKQVERALLNCNGIVEDIQTTVQKYNAGSGEMTGLLTGVLLVITRIWNDTYNASVAIVLCGPVLSALLSFGFICFISQFAAVLIWTTIVCCELAIIVLFAACAYQAGMLQEIVDQLQTSQYNGTFDLTAAAGADAIDTAQAQIGTAMDQTARDGTSGQVGQSSVTDPVIYWKIAAYASGTLALIYPLVVCVVRRQIKLAIALVKEAGRTLRRMKLLLLYPFFSYFWVVLLFLYFVFISCFIFSSTLDEAGVSSLVNGGGSTAQGILAGENVVGSATNLFQSAQNESAYAGMSVSMDINELF